LFARRANNCQSLKRGREVKPSLMEVSSSSLLD